MPVAPTRANPRTIALVTLSIVVVLVIAGALFVFALPSLNESGKVQVKLGADTFDAGPKDLRAASIQADGPILFSDVASGQRDIYLQHTGSTPDQGWLAFDARRTGQTRDCTLRWQANPPGFIDPCDGTTVAADGTGLVHYPVTVTDDGNVVIDLNAQNRRATTTTGADHEKPESTTSSILVTGSRPSPPGSR